MAPLNPLRFARWSEALNCSRSQQEECEDENENKETHHEQDEAPGVREREQLPSVEE
jgi:hypothetical protein